jgi:hypothetical protein
LNYCVISTFPEEFVKKTLNMSESQIEHLKREHKKELDDITLKFVQTGEDRDEFWRDYLKVKEQLRIARNAENEKDSEIRRLKQENENLGKTNATLFLERNTLASEAGANCYKFQRAFMHQQTKIKELTIKNAGLMSIMGNAPPPDY